MRVAIEIPRVEAGQLALLRDWVILAERLGVSMAFAAEAWWSDAVTPLAYLAAHTERIQLGTGIMQVTARTPAMTAMTALTLHDLTGGRFILGLGASGPQVVEGLHGVPFNPALTRLRETVEVCRLIFAGEKVVYEGKTLTLPRPGGQGKALRIDHAPASIPIYLATLGPKALAYTGAATEGWLGTSFSPDYPGAHFDHLEAGAREAGRDLGTLDCCVSARVSFGDDLEALLAERRPGVAFTLGAMGSGDTNFYGEAFHRAGFEAVARDIQARWLAGDRKGAAALVPDEMITGFQLLGSDAQVKARIKAYEAAGVTTLKLGLDGAGPLGPARFEALERFMDLLKDDA